MVPQRHQGLSREGLYCDKNSLLERDRPVRPERNSHENELYNINSFSGSSVQNFRGNSLSEAPFGTPDKMSGLPTEI